MTSYGGDMHYAQSQSRSPGSNPLGYNTLTTKPSGPFDDYSQQQPLYLTDIDGRSHAYNSRHPHLPVSNTTLPTYPNPWSGASSATLEPSYREQTRSISLNNWPVDSSIQMNGFPQHFKELHNHHPQYIQTPHRPEASPTDGEGDELIPTAIVIKNIPFAVKKEQLLGIMQDIRLPVPYAFNYHFDNGVFRGLAFANFQNPEDTKVVIDEMNGKEVQGRRLRVEYKKMLPLQERERIEREKRLRRGQMESQHIGNGNNDPGLDPGQNPGQNLRDKTSKSSLTEKNEGQGQARSVIPVVPGVDLNEPENFENFLKLKAFKDDTSRKVLIFNPPMSPASRKKIHSISHILGLHHAAVGNGESRHMQIFKEKPNTPSPIDLNSSSYFYNDTSRRGLNRAATIDFSEAGIRETGYYHTPRAQNSYLLDVPLSDGPSNQRGQSLREAKSFGDLQSRRASPALSSASFPAYLTQNITRIKGPINSAPPNTENTQTNNVYPINGGRDDAYISSLAKLAISSDRSNPLRGNGRLGMNGDSHVAVGGAIGSQRNHTMLNGNGHPAFPERQPRGPGIASGFTHDYDQSSDRNGQNSSSRFM